jgi:hypothetical protein
MTRAGKRGAQAPAERVTRSRPQKPPATMPPMPTTPRRSGRHAPPAGSDAAAAPVAAPSDVIRINRCVQAKALLAS